MAVQQKDYFTTRETAELLGVAVSTIQLWTNNGLLRAWTTAGGHRRIARNSVEEMLSQQQAQAVEKNNNTNKRSNSPLSIAVLEDNKQEIILYQEYFESLDLNTEILMSKDGYEGLLNIGRMSPDVIITDLIMPNIDGFEVIKAIKDDHDLDQSLIIVVSALTPDEIKVRGGLPKGVHLLSKPLSFEKLEILLRKKEHSKQRNLIN